MEENFVGQASEKRGFGMRFELGNKQKEGKNQANKRRKNYFYEKLQRNLTKFVENYVDFFNRGWDNEIVIWEVVGR